MVLYILLKITTNALMKDLDITVTLMQRVQTRMVVLRVNATMDLVVTVSVAQVYYFLVSITTAMPTKPFEKTTNITQISC